MNYEGIVLKTMTMYGHSKMGVDNAPLNCRLAHSQAQTQRTLGGSITHNSKESGRERDVTQIFMKSKDTSYEEKSPKAPYIFERDEKQLSSEEVEQGVWNARITTIEEVYKDNNIYSVSFIPTDKTVCQTWYVKKILKRTQETEFCTGAILDPTNNMCAITGEDQSPRKTLQGFVKPYASFANDKISPEIDLDGADKSKVINDYNDIMEKISSIKTPSVKERIIKILCGLLCDSQATGLGITYFDPDDNEKPIKQDIFLKIA